MDFMWWFNSFFWLCVFGRVEKEKAQAVELQAKVSEQKKAGEFKAQLEAQLKQQRLAAQQVGELLVVPPVLHHFSVLETQSSGKPASLSHQTVLLPLYVFIILKQHEGKHLFNN